MLFRSPRSTCNRYAAAGTAAYQWQIMNSSGIEDSEIPAFADPYHWLDYFPPVGAYHSLTIVHVFSLFSAVLISLLPLKRPR
jgi:hypothetical protein